MDMMQSLSQALVTMRMINERLVALERLAERAGTVDPGWASLARTGKITPEGGFAILVTAGEDLVRGNVLYIRQSGGADGKVWKVPTTGDGLGMAVGVAYAAVSANAQVWMVVSGVVHVLPISSSTAARGYAIFTSTTEAGRVEQAASVGTTGYSNHCGHFLDDGTGNGVLARAIVHWN